MYYGRRKTIIITVVIILLVVLLVAGGMFAYFFTDLFKSNQTLFYQYMEQGLETMEIEENTQLADITKLKQQKPYTINGTMTIDYSTEEENDKVEKMKDVLNNITATVTGKVDPTESLNNTNIKIDYGNVNLFNLDYAANDTVYGLKSDEVVTAYVGIRNENLKVLGQKLTGEQSSTEIADSIPEIDMKDIMNISEEEKQHIQDTYLPVLEQNIVKDNYTKQTDLTIQKDGVDYVTTAYRLDLTGQETYYVLEKLLETLKQDSITLNLIATKAKALGLGENYTNVNQLNTTIDEWIKTCQTKAQEGTDGISFVVYAYKGETVLTEIIMKNQSKISIDCKKETGSKKINMILENLSTNEEYNQIQMTYTETTSAMQTMTVLNINIDDETLVDINVTHNGAASQNNVKSNYECIITQEEGSIAFSYEQETNFVNEVTDMLKIDNTNCAILNDYGTDQLAQLILALGQRIGYLWNEKIELLGLAPYIGNTNNDLQNISGSQMMEQDSQQEGTQNQVQQ